MSKTAFGEATIAEQIVVDQGDYQAMVELLDGEDGEQLVRFAYSTDGRVRRGPLTLREKDLAKIRKALTKTGRLREALARALE